jgi:hypothetical protein
MQINIGPVSVEFSELERLLEGCVQKFYKHNNPFNGVTEVSIQKALTTVLYYLLNDRLTEGVGKGGWGKSEKNYAYDVYGKEAANMAEDSITTSALAILGIEQYIALLREYGQEGCGRALVEAWESRWPEIDVYLKNRWNERIGWGGVIFYGGHELEQGIRPSYRHTAWLLRLWLKLPHHLYVERAKKTAKYFIESYQNYDWAQEKAFTSIVAHSTLTELKRCEWLTHILDMGQIMFLQEFFEKEIIDKYDYQFDGWVSGSNHEIGRQSYTLSAMCEMPYIFEDTNSDLNRKFQKAWNETLFGKWKSKDGIGIPKQLGGPSDINLSCLAVSALMRRKELSKKEKIFLSDTGSYLINLFANKSQEALKGTYSWTLGYLLHDMCQFIGSR